MLFLQVGNRLPVKLYLTPTLRPEMKGHPQHANAWILPFAANFLEWK